MIWVILLLAVITVFAIYQEKKNFPYGCWAILVIFSGVILFATLIGLPINHAQERTNIQKYHATKETIKIVRELDPVESAALSHKIIEVNQWLAEVQYWNGTMFGLYIPDEVMKLEPIK